MSVDSYRYFHCPPGVELKNAQEIQRAAILETVPSSKVLSMENKIRGAEREAKSQRKTIKIRDFNYYVRWVPREV